MLNTTFNLKEMIFLNNSLIYITLYIFLQLLVEVKSQTTIFKPDLRYAHTATLINDKLYILGGIKAIKETFLFLDVFVPFDTNELKWVNLSENNIIPSHKHAASIKGGLNNNELFLYGGRPLAAGGAMDLVYTFDTQNNLWRVPDITGIPPLRRTGVTTVIDYNGLIYIFGGHNIEYTNDMFVLDLSWKKASSINAPSPRTQYGAVFLPNKSI